MITTIAYAQYAVAYGDWDANAATVRRLAEQAAAADLIVFPECALTGYDFPGPQAAQEASEPQDGRTAALAREIAATQDATVVLGYVEQAADGCYNAAMLVTPDGALHNYRKLHLFDRETGIFLPGDAPPPVIETPAGRVGIMICFDWFFPETARTLALAGAQIIAHPSNLVLPWCQRAMFARCVENRVFAATANRIGTETQAGRTLTFTGASQILGPDGATLSQAPPDTEYLGLARVEPEAASNKRLNAHNDLFAARRTEHYRL